VSPVRRQAVFDILLENSFDFLSPEYSDLFGRAGATAFQHPLWLAGLYLNLASRLGVEPMVIAVRWREDGRLAMVLPLVRRRHGALRVVEFADLGVSDYAAPVCEDAVFAQVVADPKARKAIRTQLKPYDLLRIKKVGDRAPPLEKLFGGDRAAMDVSAHAVSLYEPFGQWQSDNLGSSFEKELQKKRRQLNRTGEVLFECLQDVAQIADTFRAMQEYRKERFEGDLLQNPLYYDFYLDMALKGAASGFSRTYRLSVDGQAIGAIWGLCHRRQFLVLMGGFDLVTYKSQSIGALAFEDVARDCIARQDLVLDFTIGDESYKRRFGAQPSGLWMISAAATPPGQAAALLAKAPWAMKVARDFVNRQKGASTQPVEA
jgi:CelD/BcsL family acetyltransferase involved in cellulose biosynthesis